MPKENQLTSLGDFLRKIRTTKKLKQSDIARKMETDASVICRYESNQTHPSLERINNLVEAYELTSDEEAHLREILNSCELRFVKTPRELQILSQLLMLPEDIRKRVIQAANAYTLPSKNKSK